jgi:hypothetical protein
MPSDPFNITIWLPRVVSHRAGPKDVKFWISDAPPAAAGASLLAKGSPKEGAGLGMPTNTYISVYD